MCHLPMLSIWTSLIFCHLVEGESVKGPYTVGNSFVYSLNPFPNKPWFLYVYSKSLLKTLWEKEKLLETSNFSFSHSVL